MAIHFYRRNVDYLEAGHFSSMLSPIYIHIYNSVDIYHKYFFYVQKHEDELFLFLETDAVNIVKKLVVCHLQVTRILQIIHMHQISHGNIHIILHGFFSITPLST